MAEAAGIEIAGAILLEEAAMLGVGDIVATGFFSGGFGGFLADRALSFGVSSLISAVARDSSGGAFKSEAQGRQIIVRSAVVPRRIVYGEVPVSGPLVYATVTGTGEDTYFHAVIALAGHEVDAIGDVWLGEFAITPAMLDASGNVTSGRFTVDVPTTHVHSATVPATPFAVTTSETVSSVQSVTATDAGNNVFDLNDVSPSAPGEVNEYSRSGDVFTFHEDAEGYEVTVNYTETTTESYVRIKKHLGATDQAADADLVAESGGQWTAAHRLRGTAYIYVRLKRNHSVFADGVPNIKARVRGKKLYDPRTAATSWSNATALVVYEYLTAAQGFNCEATEVDEDLLNAAANACEERVLLDPGIGGQFIADATEDAISFPTFTATERPQTGDGARFTTTGTLPAPLAAGTTYYAIRASNSMRLATSYANALAGTYINLTDAGSGTHTGTLYDQPRYTCNGVVSLDERPRDVLARLLGSMAGSANFSAATWDVFAGVYQSPVISLDEDDLRGEIEVQPRPERQDLFNEVHGVFVDPAKNWQPTDFPPVKNATYVTQDNDEVLVRDIDLPFTTSSIRAQRIGKIHLEKSRQGITVSWPGKLTCWRVGVWTTVQVSIAQYGWTNKVFLVTAWKWNPEGGVDLTLQEEAAEVYDWAAGDATEEDPADDTDLPGADSVAAPGAPSITEQTYETLDGNAIKVRGLVAWGKSDGPYVRQERLEWKRVDATAWSSLVGVTGSDGQMHAAVDDLQPGYHLFKTLAENDLGVLSEYSEVVLKEIQGLAAAPAAPTILGAQAVGGLLIITLAQHPEVDVRRGGRWRVRHVQEGIAATWDVGFSIGETETWMGDQTILVLPLKPGIYMVKAEDSTGNLSVAPASIESKQASVLTYSTLSTVQEDSAFSGTHSGTAVVDGVLTLGGVGMWDDIPDLDAVTDIDGYGGISTAGTYTFAAGLDLGSVSLVRLTGRIEGSTVNLLSAFDDRTGLVDSWEDWDGTEATGAADVYLEVRETDDNPAGAPVWSGWKRLDASEFEARAFQFRAQLTSEDAAYRPEVSVLRVTAAAVV